MISETMYGDLETMKTTMTSGISSTKLLVRGYAENFSLDGLWIIVSFYGAVSNIIIECQSAREWLPEIVSNVR